MVEVYASIDLGGTKIAGALADGSGQVLCQRIIPTASHEGPGPVVQRIGALVEALMAECGTRPRALGMGVPGLVDVQSGVTRFLPNLPTQWRDEPVAERLSARLKCPVYLLNDVRTATLGELTFGKGQAVQSLAFFALGTGIGGGVVIDGKLRLGPLGAAGELGHQTIIPDGPLCGCGNRGCLETLASGPAIAAQGVWLMSAGRAPALYDLVGGDAAQVTPREMAVAATRGDEAVRDVLQRAAAYLGIGIANVVTILHPELVVLGGSVAEIGALLFDTVRQTLLARVGMFPTDGVRIEKSALGDRAGLLGGVALARGGGLRKPITQ